MSRAVNAVVIGIAVFILVAGSFWYLSVASGREKLSVDSTLSLQSADASRTRLVADLTFKNQHDVEVQLSEFAYEFRAGSLVLAKNQTSEGFPLKPRTERDESIVVQFPTDFVSDWLKQHVQSGEKTTNVFAGNATFQVGSRNQSVTFGEERPFSTDVRASLDKAENCPRPAPQPCVEGTRATWRERNDTLVLDLSLLVKNDIEEEIKVSRPEAALRFGEVGVARAETGGLVLAGGGSERLEFQLFFQHDQLKEWWPSHLEACEKSLVSAAVSFTYEVQPEDRETTTPTPTTVSSPPSVTPSNTTTTSNTTSSSPSPSPTTTSPSASPSASPTETSNTDKPRPQEWMGPHRVSFVFLEQPGEDDNRTASWNLEGSEFRSRFACDDPQALLDLP